MSKNSSHSATHRLHLLIRIVSFAAAAGFMIFGIIGLMRTVKTQSAAQSITMNSVRGQSVRHVLVLMSYDESDAATVVQRDGLLDVLEPSGIAADVFYLDARSCDYDSNLFLSGDSLSSSASSGDLSDDSSSSPSSPVSASDALALRIAEKAAATSPYDTIICAGDEALSYALARQDVLGGLPVAFFAVNDADLATEAHNSGIACGIIEQGSPATALEAARIVTPDATRAVVLVDGSFESAGLANQLPTTDTYAGFNLEMWDVTRLSRDELIQNVSELDPNNDVVLVLAANNDNSGATYIPSDTIHLLANATQAPLFTAQGGVGEGAWGSSFINQRQEAADVSALAVDLLNGADPASTITHVASPECVVYDAPTLSANGIDLDTLPDTAAVVNEPVLSLRVLRPMLKPLLYLVAAFVCILIFGLIGYFRQRSSRRAIIETNRNLQHRLTHDLLTELPNRQELDRFASSNESRRQMRSAVLVDIEDFSDINDSYGHSFGNEVICEVARRLQQLGASLVVRSGGDEFILCFDHTLTPASPELVSLYELFGEPIVSNENSVELSFHVGVANRTKQKSSEELAIFCDLACRFAKTSGVHEPVFYEDSMREAMERKIEITAYLKEAIAQDTIEVVWQPQVDAATLEVYGYEALCRLKGNVYYPADFIPVAEMSGLIIPLDRAVTRHVIEQLGAWIKEGRKVGVASINFSVAQLRDETYIDYLTDLLKQNNVPGNRLKIEITESMLVGNEEAANKLFDQLKKLGITLALDDFGTGYSSLAEMAELPTEFIKLDKSLVDAFMIQGKEGFIEHVCALVHGLSKRLVVEGVENADQFVICQRLGCDIVQGYFFSQPMSAQEVIAFDPTTIASPLPATPDKTRNKDWSTYKRDSNGRWTKKSAA